MPAGITAIKDDKQVQDIDSETPTLFRSIGNICAAMGSNLAEAVKKLDLDSMLYLKPHVRRLSLRLDASLGTDLCWERFQSETGSELISRASKMLLEGVEAGANPSEIGGICSGYTLDITQLRARRRLASSTFSFLILPMHATMVFILIFVMEILTKFSERLSFDSLQTMNHSIVTPDGLVMPPGMAVASGNAVASGFPLLHNQNLNLISWVTLIVIGVLVVSNSLAPKFASGGSNLKIAFYFATTCLISGGVMAIVPVLTERLFNI